ncbi:MAG: CBS domain-containing protein [Bacillota bacterium]|nr:CBS domain-containing protein [Bacillota bacterium]
MPIMRSFYLSRILNVKVTASNGDTVGKLKDLIVTKGEHPEVVACVIGSNSGKPGIFSWKGFTITKDNNKYKVSCQETNRFEPQEDAVFLKKHILDKQIVDIDGVKVVRVNDVRLAAVSNGVFVVAVDVGVEGLLRRLGLAKPIKRVLQLFDKSIPGRFILWDNLETLASPLENLKLSMTYSKLNTLHPSELADIIEDLDIKTRNAIFDALDYEKAADVMEELETDFQVSILNSMTLEKAADVLEKMPADEVADILDDLEEEKAEELLDEMEHEVSEEVRELMEYPEDTVGSLMSTDFISFNEEMTVNDTINELRKQKPESDTIYYLYVLDSHERLIATVSLRDLIVSEPETKLHEIMNRKILYVYDNDDISSLMDMVTKYSLLAIPVVNEEMKMMGITIIDDLVYELLKPKRKKM